MSKSHNSDQNKRHLDKQREFGDEQHLIGDSKLIATPTKITRTKDSSGLDFDAIKKYFQAKSQIHGGLQANSEEIIIKRTIKKRCVVGVLVSVLIFSIFIILPLYSDLAPKNDKGSVILLGILGVIISIVLITLIIRKMNKHSLVMFSKEIENQTTDFHYIFGEYPWTTK